MTHDPLLNVAEVAKWLNVSRGWVRDHASGRRQPQLPSIPLGKAIRFSESALNDFIAQMAEIVKKRAV